MKERKPPFLTLEVNNDFVFLVSSNYTLQFSAFVGLPD